MNKAILLCLKNRQARREEKGLLIANERRTTRHGAFSGATRRAEPLFLSSGVITRLCELTTPRSFCLAGQKQRPGSTALFIESTPKQ